jgi:hypothetical protein
MINHPQRLITRNEDPGGHPVAVLSYGFWERRFARDPGVVGKSIRIRGESISIIGVAMPGFFGERVGMAPDLWLPLTLWPRVIPGRNLLRSPGTAWLDIIGRQRPGVPLATTEATLTVLFRRVLAGIFGPSVVPFTPDVSIPSRNVSPRSAPRDGHSNRCSARLRI